MVREMKVGRQKCKAFLLYSCIVVLTFIVSTLPASASVVGETDGFPLSTDMGFAPDDLGELSFSFTTDANDYVFNSVSLYSGEGSFSDGLGSFGVILRVDDETTPGTPGDMLDFLSGDSDPTEANTEYLYSGSAMLTANTTYWISIFTTDPDDNFFEFLTAATTAESAASVWSIGDDIYSPDSGFQGATGPFASRFDATIVNQTPVPVPGSALLFFGGLIGVLGLRLNKQLF